jgi:integrase
MYSAKEIKALLSQAAPQLKAMILLALNGGFGNGDLSEMPRTAIDLKGTLVNYPRPKTGVERRVPLWPETVAAIQILPTFDSGRVFELPTGHPWIRIYDGGCDDEIGRAFGTLCDVVKVTNRGFYSLRRTFRTLADESADQRAIALVMGHECGDIGGIYVQKIRDERLRAVVDCVRSQIASALV